MDLPIRQKPYLSTPTLYSGRAWLCWLILDKPKKHKHASLFFWSVRDKEHFFLQIWHQSDELQKAADQYSILKEKVMINFIVIFLWNKSGKSCRMGGLTTVDLLLLTSLDQLLFILNIFTFFTKQTTLMRRSTVLSLPPWLVFPE